MFWRLARVSPCEGNIVMRLTCSGDTASEEEAESGVAGEDMVIVGLLFLFVVLKLVIGVLFLPLGTWEDGRWGA